MTGYDINVSRDLLPELLGSPRWTSKAGGVGAKPNGGF